MVSYVGKRIQRGNDVRQFYSGAERGQTFVAGQSQVIGDMRFEQLIQAQNLADRDSLGKRNGRLEQLALPKVEEEISGLVKQADNAAGRNILKCGQGPGQVEADDDPAPAEQVGIGDGDPRRGPAGNAPSANTGGDRQRNVEQSARARAEVHVRAYGVRLQIGDRDIRPAVDLNFQVHVQNERAADDVGLQETYFDPGIQGRIRVGGEVHARKAHIGGLGYVRTGPEVDANRRGETHLG